MKEKVNIPFTGNYMLGESFAHLNKYREVAYAIEIFDIDSRAVVLADCGGKINTAAFQPTRVIR